MLTLALVIASLFLSFIAVHMMRWWKLFLSLRDAYLRGELSPSQQKATGLGAVGAVLVETTIYDASFWCIAIGAFALLHLVTR